ncbi:hypothetical protein BU23DRAFT_552630 [Bimuria novae-zelandiae CBS 107.79]|uniref:Uncharacterized protein n=1 Tax=Bimuria novae-zelandiae CBS 107.79 TaxID=1447943 RepID=A0A6A5VCM3_9PLEO|nr:hypothetical protein BU23DRAFT_552630 [Bimuria novae-zelandiae CBS 107.79]
MFRHQVLWRSFSLFRRTPTSAIVKSAAKDGHNATRIQRVRITQRFFTKSRMVGTAVVAVGAWRLFVWLDEEVEDEEEVSAQVRRVRRPPIRQDDAEDDKGGREITDEEEEELEDDEEEEEDDEGLIFLPTGFSRPRPRRFYRGSDPEWQTFIRLAPDRKRMEKIREELITTVRDLATKNAHIKMHLGKIDTTKGKVWIEVKFPDGPPLEYEQPGIELTEDLTIRKTTRPVHEMHHKRLARVLMPTGVMNSVYYDMKRRMFASWQDFKRYTGLEETRPTAQSVIKGLPLPPAVPVSPTQTPSAPNTPAAPASADTEKQVTSPLPPSPSNSALEKLGLSLPGPEQVPTMDLSYFRQIFRKYHKHMAIEPPRGTFIVSGLVEIIGDRAKMTLDVMSLYDPNVGKYVLLQARVRSITPYKQRPRGGP